MGEIKRHSDAAKRVINDLWRKGLLRYTVLPPKIVEMLSRKKPKQLSTTHQKDGRGGFTMTNDQIVKIANSLSNDDLVRLIDAVSPRLEVFVGILNGCCITGSVEGACTNGHHHSDKHGTKLSSMT